MWRPIDLQRCNRGGGSEEPVEWRTGTLLPTKSEILRDEERVERAEVWRVLELKEIRLGLGQGPWKGPGPWPEARRQGWPVDFQEIWICWGGAVETS